VERQLPLAGCKQAVDVIVDVEVDFFDLEFVLEDLVVVAAGVAGGLDVLELAAVERWLVMACEPESEGDRGGTYLSRSRGMVE
jgi:hypothetical protein